MDGKEELELHTLVDNTLESCITVSLCCFVPMAKGFISYL